MLAHSVSVLVSSQFVVAMPREELLRCCYVDGTVGECGGIDKQSYLLCCGAGHLGMRNTVQESFSNVILSLEALRQRRDGTKCAHQAVTGHDA